MPSPLSGTMLDVARPAVRTFANKKTRVPNIFGRGQVPHTNGLTVSLGRTRPTRRPAPTPAPRAVSDRPLAAMLASWNDSPTNFQAQVRVRYWHSSRKMYSKRSDKPGALYCQEKNHVLQKIICCSAYATGSSLLGTPYRAVRCPRACSGPRTATNSS